MSVFDDAVSQAKISFPNIKIKFKDQSRFMTALGTILFFNKKFTTNYITTIGNSIYFPAQSFVVDHPVDSTITLLHELTHLYDAKKQSWLFILSYLFPQFLSLFAIPLFFLFGYLGLIPLVALLPLPAYYRMMEEKKAYTVSLYCYYFFSKQGYDIDFNYEKSYMSSQFKGSSYYFMWPFNSINSYFDNILVQMQNGEKPSIVDPEIYGLIDQILKP